MVNLLPSLVEVIIIRLDYVVQIDLMHRDMSIMTGAIFVVIFGFSSDFLKRLEAL